MLYKKFSLIILFVLFSNLLFSQTVNIRGIVSDGENDTPLSEANIIIETSNIGSSSNNKGFFSINNIKTGKHVIVVSYSGYKTIRKEIFVSKDKSEFNFEIYKSYNKLNEIVVIATGTPHILRNTPIKTELFLKDQIETLSSRSIEDLLSKLSPSIDFSPNKMGSRMKINGLGNDYILILINGKRLHGDIGGLNDLSRINTLNIERIELIKGASSALYGSEAMAGVINIITKTNNNNLLIENSSRYGTYGDLQQYNGINLKGDKISSETKFSLKSTDGWQNSNLKWVRDRKNRGKKKLEKTYAKSVNQSVDFEVSQKINYKFNKHMNAYVDGSFYQKDIKQDKKYAAYGFFYQNKSLGIGSEHIFNTNNKLYFNSSFNNYKYYNKYAYKYVSKHIDDNGKKELVTHHKGEKSLNSNQIRYNAELKWIYKINSWNLLNTGLDYTRKTLEAPYRISNKKVSDYTLSAYVQDEINIKKHISMVCGFRYIKNKEFGSMLTPKLAFIWKIKNINIRTNYSSGYKTPTLKELYMKYETSGMGSHNLYLGNTNLKAQKSKYISLSAQYNKPKFSFSMSAYKNKISDMIAYRIIDTKAMDAEKGIVKTKEHYNIGSAETKGFEIIANSRISRNLDITTSYSYLDAKNRTKNISLDGTSHHYANINCTWTMCLKNAPFLKFNFSGKLQSKKFYERGISTKDKEISGDTEAYNLWDINVKHKFPSYKNTNIVAYMSVKNIFDYLDDSPIGQNHASLNPGRTLSIGLNIKFIK